MARQAEGFGAIFDAAATAGQLAAAVCVPETIRVEGIVYADGDCGSAYFEFDGRTAFGKWLRRRTSSGGRSSRFYAHGLGQSADRSTAYLIAFRTELAKHGIIVGPVRRVLD